MAKNVILLFNNVFNSNKKNIYQEKIITYIINNVHHVHQSQVNQSLGGRPLEGLPPFSDS